MQIFFTLFQSAGFHILLPEHLSFKHDFRIIFKYLFTMLNFSPLISEN